MIQENESANACEGYGGGAQRSVRTIGASLASALFQSGCFAGAGELLQKDEPSFSGGSQDGLGEEGMLLIVERTIEIGDTVMSERHLAAWQHELEQSSDVQVQRRIRNARERLTGLLKEEKARGRFGCLNRSAPEIISYERECRRRGWQSIYGNFRPEISEFERVSANLTATPIALS
jgi:hypothetical protein